MFFLHKYFIPSYNKQVIFKNFEHIFYPNTIKNQFANSMGFLSNKIIYDSCLREILGVERKKPHGKFWSHLMV